MAPTIERIASIPILKNGEAPHWDIKSQSLYFVDVVGKTIHRYVPSTGQHTSVQLEKEVTVIIPVKDKPNQFVISLKSKSGNELDIITWDGTSEKLSNIEKIADIEQGTENTPNDGKIDPKGRLWIGSVGPVVQLDPIKLADTGSLFSLEKRKISTQVTGIACSNGLTFNAELKRFYYIDSVKQTVDAFDYNAEKGTVSNRREIFTFSKHNKKGFPDGMTIDKDGNLWVGVFAGTSVLKIDPRKPETLLQTLDIPALEVTSVAWGGKNLDVLYVTSSSIPFGVKELPPGDNGGSVFKVTGLGTSGLPMDNFVL